MVPESIIYPLGENALVLDPAPRAAIDYSLQSKLCWIADSSRNLAGVLNAVPGMNNLTLYFDNPERLKSGEAILQQLWDEAEQHSLPQRNIDIPVIYGGEYGPDIDNVANAHQLSVDAVISLHSSARYRVFFIGFQPGFAYLDGLPTSLHTPRLSIPRQQVPAGSIGIGGEQTGIYPSQSPGGWQLIGQTNLKLFNPLQRSPNLLQPGDIVTFVPVRSFTS
ncbi:5-oxoprolinase subunit PxpB [Shewanella mesophila]|uniref:5-oxoprolinase subunit PxpB n=1 Tax=Shewanella mesophila TaxID=2864208 RepID=UPI001C6592C8|nr:5-oxoprolinase subunit PxpB [Shewanella mesophila]QYJ86213.1 5-oxoprolinase subunit PxpB [Shewanella mesophila]